MLLATIDVAEAACDALEHALGISHIVVTEESTLRSYVSESYYRTPLIDSIQLLGYLQHLVERDSRNIQSLVQEIVVEIIVCTMLTNIRAHSNRVEHEVNLATELADAGCYTGRNPVWMLFL